jgi:hypothetical protein
LTTRLSVISVKNILSERVTSQTIRKKIKIIKNENQKVGPPGEKVTSVVPVTQPEQMLLTGRDNYPVLY